MAPLLGAFYLVETENVVGEYSVLGFRDNRREIEQQTIRSVFFGGQQVRGILALSFQIAQ